MPRHGMIVSGLGILLEELDGFLVVQKVFPGGPVWVGNEQALKIDPDAETVKIGDVLLTLGDRDIQGMTEAAIKEVFLGPPDTCVHLGFVRCPLPTQEPSVMHFSLDVLRRSSVRSRTEIFQGTPEKDGDKSKVSPKKVTKEMSQNGGHGTTDKKMVTEDELTSCGSVSLTSGDIESMAHENAVLKESLVNLEEQLEMAERKMDASMKIVEKVQQLEDKLLETEFKLSLSQKHNQHNQAERAAIQENSTLKEMLNDAQRLHTFAIENCRQSEKESELAQHSIRLHVEREKALKDELEIVKTALEESRVSETLLRQQLRSAEIKIKRLTADNENHDSAKRPVNTPPTSPARKQGETSSISRQLLRALEEREEWKAKCESLEIEMKSFRGRVQTSLNYLSRMALINESLEARSEKDASKVDMNVKNISPWVVSALNHIAAESQPPHRRDHSVIKLRDDILSGASDEAVSNSLFDLGCLFSMASQDSFSSDFVEAIILDVSRHLDDSRLAHSDVMRFAIFCLCSLSSWSLGRRTLAGSDAAKKLVHILSSSDDLLVLEFTALVLGNCSSEPQGSSVVVLGAPTLCRMLKSRSANLRRNALVAVCNLSLNRNYARVIAAQPDIVPTLQALCRSQDTLERKRGECTLRHIDSIFSS